MYDLQERKLQAIAAAVAEGRNFSTWKAILPDPFHPGVVRLYGAVDITVPILSSIEHRIGLFVWDEPWWTFEERRNPTRVFQMIMKEHC